MKTPVVELGDCILCGICIEVASSVFKLSSAGYIEIFELPVYPETEVDEAIKNCPTDCISWTENKCMDINRTGGRILKKKILEILSGNNFNDRLSEIRRFPGRQVVNHLFSCLYNTDELIKWRAVTAMGDVVSSVADADIESARVVMRRLMWNLNDESGGIG